MVDIIDDGAYPHPGIDAPQPALRSHCLGQGLGRVVFIEQYLALQVAQLDNIAVDDHQVSNPCPGEQVRADTAQCSAAQQQGSGAEQSPLSGFAKTG